MDCQPKIVVDIVETDVEVDMEYAERYFFPLTHLLISPNTLPTTPSQPKEKKIESTPSEIIEEESPVAKSEKR